MPSRKKKPKSSVKVKDQPQAESAVGVANGNLVCVALADSAESSDLCDQLGFFGFRTVAVQRLSAVERAITSAPRSVVIVDMALLDADGEPGDLLLQLKESPTHCTRVIFVSGNDGFDLRLSAIRAGADAFFAVPLEISRLIDKIDSLFGQSNRDPYHVLVVGDNPDDVSIYAHMLQGEGMITSVVSDPRNLFPVLIEAKPELILMDLQMDDWSGVELTQIIRQLDAFISIPIVFISDETAGVEKRLAAIALGGDEFVNRPVVPRYLGELLRLRAARSRNMRFFMERDSLTGLLNHSNLREKLSAEMRRAERIGSSLCFCMIDIDHFKLVNDTYGHLTGDRVLKGLSRLLQDRLRKTDIVGRYGGEEFGVILFDTTIDHAARIMDEIRESFAHIRQQFQDKVFYVTFSCGLASFPTHNTVSELSEAADRAMYEAKQRGRNQICVAQSDPD